MTEYDWIWLNMTEYDWIWLNMTEYDYDWIWLNMTEYERIWLNMIYKRRLNPMRTEIESYEISCDKMRSNKIKPYQIIAD